MHGVVLRVRAPRHRVRHVFAGLESRHTLAGPFHDSRRFGSQNRRQCHWIKPLAMVRIDEIDPRHGDLNQHFARARFRRWALAILQHLDPARLLDVDSFHTLVPSVALYFASVKD